MKMKIDKELHAILSHIFIFTAMQCDYGMVYTACGSPCPQTCRNIGDEPESYCDSATCVEGCFCPDGYVQSGNN